MVGAISKKYVEHTGDASVSYLRSLTMTSCRNKAMFTLYGNTLIASTQIAMLLSQRTGSMACQDGQNN